MLAYFTPKCFISRAQPLFATLPVLLFTCSLQTVYEVEAAEIHGCYTGPRPGRRSLGAEVTPGYRDMSPA